MNLYTHRCTVVVNHPRLGCVDGSFSTTADAVESHREALEVRKARGRVASYLIAMLPEVAHRQFEAEWAAAQNAMEVAEDAARDARRAAREAAALAIIRAAA